MAPGASRSHSLSMWGPEVGSWECAPHLGPQGQRLLSCVRKRSISLISSVGLVFFFERHCPLAYLATRKGFFPFTSHGWHLYLFPATPAQGNITSSFENRDHTRPVLDVSLP